MTNKYPNEEMEQAMKEQALSHQSDDNFLTLDQSIEDYVNYMNENGQELVDAYTIKKIAQIK